MLKDGYRLKQNCTPYPDYADRVQLTAITGFQQFKDVFVQDVVELQGGDNFFYCLQHGNGIDWEYGIGYLTSKTYEIDMNPVLKRNTVIKSTNSNNLIDLTTTATNPHLISNMPICGFATGDVNFQNCYVENATLKGYSEKVVELSAVDNATNLAVKDANVFLIYLNDNVTITINYDPWNDFNYRKDLVTNTVDQLSRSFTLYVWNTSQSALQVQFSSAGTLKTNNNTTINLSAIPAGTICELVFRTIDEGGTWFYSLGGKYA